MRFKRIYIEITNTCNLSCSFCIQNQRTPRRMQIKEFQHIVDQIRPYCEYVYLHVLGEPLSHPQVDAILHILDSSGLQVNITTNGTLLKQQEEMLLTHNIRQLNVSLHSFPQHVQKQYFENIFSTCEKLAKQGVYVNYRSWNLLDNHAQEETKALLQVITKQYDIDSEQISMKRLQRLPLQDHISLHFEEVFTWPSLRNAYVNDIGRCLGMKDMCAILSNGDVVPCCLDSNADCVLGNIHTSSFYDIVHGNRAQHFMDALQQQHMIEPLCQHCSYRLRFYDASRE